MGGELDRRIKELHNTHPGLAEEFKAYEDRIKTQVACLKKGGDYEYQDWKIDGRSTGGDPDVFKFFLERAHQLARDGGRVGYVVPSAIYNNEGCTGLRHLLLDHADIERFYAFENRKKIFNIHSSYKFVNLVFRKGEPKSDSFEAALMRHDLEELTDPAPKPWQVTVRRKELEHLSPGTLAFLEYRSPRDREILLKMYQGRPLLGDEGSGTWNAKFYTEFHMTNDKDLWTDPATGKLWTVKQILGTVPAYYQETREQMAEKGFWPLYEGKHIEQFLVDIKAIERWVSLEACQAKYGKPPDPGPKVVFRDIARNTDMRTLIAAVLPAGSCANNKLPIVKTDLLAPEKVAAVLNSFAFDFALRFRVSSTLNFTHVSRVVVPKRDQLNREQTIFDVPAPAGLQHIRDLPDAWPQVWAINRIVADAYSLAPDDFEHILSTFPVFARKRPEFYAYLQERLAEWKEEVGESPRRKAKSYLPAEPSEEYPKAAEPRGPAKS